MRFKAWYTLNELDYIDLEAPQTINGFQCDAVDMRYEDWGKGFNPQKNIGTDVRMSLPNPKKFIGGSFKAPCREGWFVVDQRKSNTNSPQTKGNLGLATQARPEIQVISQVTPEIEEIPSLPSAWFRFAALYMGNDVVKEPEWTRGDYELVKTKGRTEKRTPFKVEG